MRCIAFLLLLVYAPGSTLAQNLCPLGGPAAPLGGLAASQVVEINFPNGDPNPATINVFIIFFQHRNDVFDNDFTSDPVTEWPADWSSVANGRQLPAWAGQNGEDLLAPPGTAPADFAEGSLSEFYNIMSGGRLTITGDVYPQVYIPEQDPQWYVDNRENPAHPSSTGALQLSREILNSQEIQDYFATNYPGNAIEIFDQYTNGQGGNLASDGLFDMIILMPRLSSLPRLVENCDAGQTCTGYTSITNFGTRNHVTGSDSFDDVGDPVTIGTLGVVDNSRSGSGVIGEAYTRKAAVRIIGHEIGHRHFYLLHTCNDQDAATDESECVGIMSGGPFLTFSAPDRIKLNWADVTTLDINTINGVQNHTLPALTANANEVLRIQDGANAACGDVVIESRTWSNFWDRPPDGMNDDGTDNGDFFLPQEGLYIYKAATGGACGTADLLYSSMESNGTVRDPDAGFRNGSIYRTGFVPGSFFTPFSRYEFDFHQNNALDDNLAITDIAIAGNNVSFNVWSDYPTDELNGAKQLTDDHTFGDEDINLARDETWNLNGPFALEGDFVSTNGSAVTIQNGGTIDLVDNPDNPGNTIILEPGDAAHSGAVMTFEMGSTLALGAHAVIEVRGIPDGVEDNQDGLLTLQDGVQVDFAGNCGELTPIDEGRIEVLDDMALSMVCACTLPKNGGIFRLAAGQSLTYQNDAFMANDEGIYRFEDNTTVQVAFSAQPLLITPGSAFELGNGASFQIKNDPDDTQNLVGTASDPILFTGGEVVFDGSTADLAHVAFDGTAVHVQNGADVTIYADGGTVVLRPGFHAHPGSRFKVVQQDAPDPTPSPGQGAAQARTASAGAIAAASMPVAAQVAAEPSNALPVADEPHRDLALVEAAAEAVPTAFSLSANYPNPFNPTTTISYALKEDVQVTLKVYNVLGQHVATLVDGFERAGYKSVTWDGRDAGGIAVPSGAYVYRLAAGDFVQARTMLLLK